MQNLNLVGDVQKNGFARILNFGGKNGVDRIGRKTCGGPNWSLFTCSSLINRKVKGRDLPRMAGLTTDIRGGGIVELH